MSTVHALSRRFLVAALSGTVFLGMTASPALAQLASSTFNVDAEGWLVQGDATSAIPDYNAAGGNPGGFISADDSVAGGVWFWRAPAKFLGNKSAAYNETLTFDLIQSLTTTQFNDVDISLAGGGITLVFDTPNNPGTDWTPYSILLNESAGWRVGNLAGAAPSALQMQTVLSSLTDLRIRGEFRTGADTGSLDNVFLNGTLPSAAAPEPASVSLLATGLLTVAGFLRRKRG